jgi:hypothetical protein
MKKVAPCSLLVALALALVVPSAALAQDQPPPASSPPPSEPVRMASGAGLGVGAVAFLSGPAAAEVVYDMSKFHIEGLFGFNHDESSDSTAYVFGARGWYHLHSGSNSDFSLGGGLGVTTASGPMDSSLTATFIEPGALARVFLTPNFALHGTVGFRLVFGDDAAGDGDIGLGGQVMSAFGFSYFFR